MRWAEVIPQLAAKIKDARSEAEIVAVASEFAGKPVSLAAVRQAWRSYVIAHRPDGWPKTLNQLIRRNFKPEADLTAEEISGPPPSALELHSMRKKLQEAERHKRDALAELQLSHERLETVLACKANEAQLAPVVPREKRSGIREATAVAMASDWHIEETIDPRTVDGVNEYNPGIAAKRSARFFEAVHWQIGHHRQGWKIRDLMLWLGGDLITGYIHDELQESNALAPLEAVLTVRDFIIAGIDGLLAKAKLERILIPTSFGNHGRMHKKPRIKTAAENNFEWLLYHMLATHYAKERRVDFRVTRGQEQYVEIYGEQVRVTHGDRISGGNGIGGIAVPILRAVHKWNSSRRAKLTLMGHFHTYSNFGEVMVNGSLIGHGPYSIRMGFPYRPPQQAFFLIDSKRWKIQDTPLWVDG